jgi:plasmid stabilization system protein ParE
VSRYIISQPAIRDLESISAYFANVNIEVGEKFYRDLANVASNL